MALLPMAMYGLEVPPGDIAIMAHADIPAAFRVTMAAIDPSAEPEGDADEIRGPRATLKVLRLPLGADDSEMDDSEDDMDIEDMDAQFGENDSDDDDDSDVNGGPSDPTKSKKAKRVGAMRKQIKDMLDMEGMDVDENDEDDDEIPNGVNGIVKSKKAKGKMPASDEDEDEEDDDDDDSDMDDEEGAEIEEFVLCTLDPNKTFQQPLDITVGEDERVWFKVTGTHTIYLTGNYVEPTHDRSGMFDPDSDEDDEYDLSPAEDELDDDDDESIDELDDMEDPRITEIDEMEDEVPTLIKAKSDKETKPGKGKNKRPAQESADEDEVNGGAETLDDMIKKEAKTAQPVVNGEQKLSKKQLKKLKKNDGVAANAPVTDEKKDVVEPPSSNKSDKKVSFAAQLEQGPTPTKDKAGETQDTKPKTSASLGSKTVQGVTIDDRKLGSGQAAKNGDRVSMRYIGKLKADNRIFDSNKKGKPFNFKLGSSEVVKGMDIGVLGLQAGGERRITIPAHLAYGSKKTADIPPNSTLIFDIKMLEINKGK